MICLCDQSIIIPINKLLHVNLLSVKKKKRQQNYDILYKIDNSFKDTNLTVNKIDYQMIVNFNVIF